jgi:hypothetical protein
MQATIKFEADVEKVRNIMYSLVLEETQALSDAINCMESIGDATSDRLIEGISESLVHIHGATRQLEQYRDMVASFEQARLQTTILQPADKSLAEDLQQVNQIKESIQKLDSFLSKINEETPDDSGPEEG